MIDRTFIEKICEMSAPAVLNIDGRSYSSKSIHPVHDPMPDALCINTLTGIVDFIGGIDGIGPDKAMIHVTSETDARLIGALSGVFRNRDTYVHAKYTNPTFKFGNWMDLENFIINIQAGFVQDDMTAAILKVVGNLKDETVTNFSDDGKTQAVTAKTGIIVVRRGHGPKTKPERCRPYSGGDLGSSGRPVNTRLNPAQARKNGSRRQPPFRERYPSRHRRP